uniref:Uncharacterized protein n=1 Tax=Anguilla anguilla TaxID=7936 RepID=A0A0E9SWU7_ANGAN
MEDLAGLPLDPPHDWTHLFGPSVE